MVGDDEDTDLKDDELDENYSRKMSIRALNVNMLQRYTPNSVVKAGFGQISNKAVPFESKAIPRKSMLNRASSLILNQKRVSTSSKHNTTFRSQKNEASDGIHHRISQA